MIDKTAILQHLKTSTSGPILIKELLRHFKVGGDERVQFNRMLRDLMASGDIIELKKNRVGLPEQMGLIVGHLQVHRDGFGFVVPKDKGRSDIYISRSELKDAMHGDLVVATTIKGTERRTERRQRGGKLNEGTIVRILQRGLNRIVGTYQERGDSGFVIPEDPRLPFKISIDGANALHARDEQLVVAQILRYNERHRQPDGEVIEILGFPHTPGMDEKIVIPSIRSCQ